MNTFRKWKIIVPVAGLVLFLALLYARPQGADESVYFENMALLRHLQQLDAQWDAEVLRSRIGLEADYDSLIRPGIELSDLLKQLDSMIVTQHDGHDDATELSALTRELRTAVEEKTGYIEKFKSHNAVLRNSLAFLPVAEHDIRATILRDIADHDVQRNSRRTITDVLLATLIYRRTASTEQKVVVDTELRELAGFDKQLPAYIAEQLTMFRAHVNAVLREQDTVNELLRLIAAVPTTLRVEAISTLLDSERRVRSIRAHRHQNYLLASSVVLAILLVYSAAQLLRNHGTIKRVNRQLQQTNETLEQKVRERTRELETSHTMLNATLESTADAVLAIQGKAVFYNALYREMWNVPDEVLQSPEQGRRMRWNAEQVKNPEAYISTIREHGGYPKEASFEMFELKDGRFIERYVRPQRIDGKVVGVVINFRDITQRKRDEAELANIHQQLLQASRQAGMAEVATGVLHNVGNVLNSVNVSANLVADTAKQSKVSSLVRAASLLREHQDGLAQFMEQDPRGRHMVRFLSQLGEHLQAEQQATIREMETLRGSIDHIKEIVAMQQSCAKVSGFIESLNVIDLVEDTLRISDAALHRHGVTVERQFEPVPSINADKHKILQILVNLVTNAKRACGEGEATDRRITVRVSHDSGVIRIAVSDNGIGIAAENLTRIFSHGFTTRKDGHGFGLHSGALAARELGGALHAHSEGLGRGATFTLELPLQEAELAYGT